MRQSCCIREQLWVHQYMLDVLMQQVDEDRCSRVETPGQDRTRG